MPTAGADLGTECVKTIVLSDEGKVIGRAAVATRGYFQDCFQEAMTNALAEAQVPVDRLERVCATGFAASCAPAETWMGHTPRDPWRRGLRPSAHAPRRARP